MNKRKILLAIIILLIFIIVCILIILSNLKEQEQEEYSAAAKEVIVEEEINVEIEPVIIRNNYYIVKSCVESFYRNCELLSEDSSEKYVSVIYDMLDSKYISYSNITKDNIITKVPNIKESVVHITNMYVSEQTTHFSMYIVEGTLMEKLTSKITPFKMIVQIDAVNGTFSILLDDYVKENVNKLNEGYKFVINDLKNIEANANNTYKYRHISDDSYIEDLFKHYKEEVLYNPELAYNNLDREYKNARFKNFENYNKYTKENTKKNVMVKVDKYQKTNEDGYTKYVLIDQFGNYYIFKTTAIMKYSLILDTYTIDLPEFLEKYNQASTTEKVGYNIQKCIDAINDKNYIYVYNKLDKAFKENYYNAVESFENEIKTNLFNINKVETVKALNEGDTYIYELQIVDSLDKSKSKQMTVIMQLLEGTDFVMSFSF